MRDILNSLLISLWFMFLTFPLMAVRVNTIEKVIQWRWMNVAYIGLATFLGSFAWRYFLQRRSMAGPPSTATADEEQSTFLAKPAVRFALGAVILAAALVLPWVTSTYQINIMISALTYVVLGLGLNIVVGLSGLLVLGYAAFFAVGSYTYGLLNLHYGLGFWAALPIGGVMGALCGLILGFPVLRLRGDYLAIVTLGFGEIIRLVLENWNSVFKGPSGIANISRPGLFGMELSIQDATIYAYYLMLALVIVTMVAIQRIKESRVGRAWMALREDEIACEAMGIDKTKAKLMAFALGSFWAGMAGVVFAAKTTFINPASFTFLESAIILAIVVLGGMGSVGGVVMAALVLILLPEYLRAFSQYRMLIFGATMVLMMVFRPQGLSTGGRRKYILPPDAEASQSEANGVAK